jgi:hypothetical protein
MFAQRHEKLNVHFQLAVCHAVRPRDCSLFYGLSCAGEASLTRDWHFLLPCIEVRQSILCDQNPAEYQHVKIRPSLLLQHSDTQCHHVKLCPSLFVCFHGRPWQATDVPQPSWLFVPPALDVPTLATRCSRAYRRVPHSSGGSWNLWAGNKDR